VARIWREYACSWVDHPSYQRRCRGIKSLDTDLATLEALLEVDTKGWSDEMEQIREYLEGFGDRLPHQMIVELNKVVADLGH